MAYALVTLGNLGLLHARVAPTSNLAASAIYILLIVVGVLMITLATI
jgi:hypothetical protein